MKDSTKESERLENAFRKGEVIRSWENLFRVFAVSNSNSSRTSTSSSSSSGRRGPCHANNQTEQEEVEEETEFGFGYSYLPGYQPCEIFQAATQLFTPSTESSSLKRFLKKLENNVNGDETMEAIAMAVTIHLILNDKKRVKISLLQRESNLSKSSLESHHVTQPVSSYDESLLLEGWPLIQNHISWGDCVYIFQCVFANLHIIDLAHPLTQYAQDTLLNLSDGDFQQSIYVACTRYKIIRQQPVLNRLQASQLFLDYVASLPSRRVAILLEDPFLKETGEELRLSQSCLPMAVLELKKRPSIMSSPSSTDIRLGCDMIAMYDGQNLSSSISVHTRPVSVECQCLRCLLKKNPQMDMSTSPLLEQDDKLEDSKRLAHALFQEDMEYDLAKSLYQSCYDTMAESREEKAELCHCLGAVELTRKHFVKAQEHWQNGKQFAVNHSGLALQIEKQEVYEYWEPVSSPSSKKDSSPFKNLFPYETHSPGRLFVAPSIVPPSVCEDIICSALEFGVKEGGWTTSRHYAVPTNDIPVHKIPTVLAWFQQWMKEDIQPLLQDQFQSQGRFYVHDAFIVRYTATSKSRFLPLHYDESTHSMVLSLNEDFDGGGTYFYDVNETICPKSRGSLVSFRGDKMLHGGNIVTRGTRFILAVFMYMDDDSTKTKVNTVSPSAKKQKIETYANADNTTGFSFNFMSN